MIIICTDNANGNLEIFSPVSLNVLTLIEQTHDLFRMAMVMMTMVCCILFNNAVSATYIRARAHTHTHTNVNVNTYTHIHAYIHIHQHTYIHAYKQYSIWPYWRHKKLANRRRVSRRLSSQHRIKMPLAANSLENQKIRPSQADSKRQDTYRRDADSTPNQVKESFSKRYDTMMESR